MPITTWARAITLWQMLGDQHMKPRDSGHALAQPCPGQPMAGLIDQGDIMMVLGPVIPGIQHQPHSPSPAAPLAPASGELPRSNGLVLTPQGGHDIPSAVLRSPPTSRGT